MAEEEFISEAELAFFYKREVLIEDDKDYSMPFGMLFFNEIKDAGLLDIKTKVEEYIKKKDFNWKYFDWEKYGDSFYMTFSGYLSSLFISLRYKIEKEQYDILMDYIDDNDIYTNEEYVKFIGTILQILKSKAKAEENSINTSLLSLDKNLFVTKVSEYRNYYDVMVSKIIETEEEKDLEITLTKYYIEEEKIVEEQKIISYTYLIEVYD